MRSKKLSVRCAAAAIIVVLASISLLANTAKADRSLSKLALPVDCNLGTECFVQQMPDVDPGPLAIDPLCGNATYDGHDGWDFRVRSMVDVARGVPVVSVADGRVLRVRDGVPDRIIVDGDDTAQLQGIECGNGVVVEHGSGLTSQYCHLRMGSIVVRPGMSVTQSTQLGLIGSSGRAQFPHVHFAMQRDGAAIDPLTGRFLQQELGCGPTPFGLFAESVRKIMERPALAILATGLSSVPPTLPSLIAGEVPVAKNGGEATLAWVWAINMRQGDQFRIQIVQPDGTTMLDQSTEPLPRRMANYLAYSGRRRTIVPGTYRIVIDLLRDGVSDVTTQMAVDVKK